ncbi:MAG: P1 family peptidase [Spirochaetota bacterium]
MQNQEFERGRLNKISDVPGVLVGHCTIDEAASKTGVTVIIPTPLGVYAAKPVAASFVLNGYGKSTGLIQINELGTLETPIALTNTLNVGLVYDALVEHAIQECEATGLDLRSVNPVVCECNDSYLNDIKRRVVKAEHVFQAIHSASADFAEGDVGAGKGMSCHQLKGGIGSASRLVTMDGRKYTLGVLVLSNHGLLRDLVIQGQAVGEELIRTEGMMTRQGFGEAPDKGSIIIILASDLPLSDRQLGRVCRRSGIGLARLGSRMGHGSGEIAVAFSTAYPVKLDETADILSVSLLNEERMDTVFRASIEAVEEAVLKSMLAASRVEGRDGHMRESLGTLLPREFMSGLIKSN